MRDYTALHPEWDTNQSKGTAFIVRKDMDVNEHERLSRITPRHKLK